MILRCLLQRGDRSEQQRHRQEREANDDSLDAMVEANVEHAHIEANPRVDAMIEAGELSSTAAKTVLARIRSTNEDPETVAKELDLIQKSDNDEIEKWVDEAIAANPGPVEQYKQGEDKVIGFLVGAVMKASRGQANPALVNKVLKNKLGS